MDGNAFGFVQIKPNIYTYKYLFIYYYFIYLCRYSKWEALEKSEQLIKCCETINKCYGPMLLIMLISFFGLITTNLYVAYLQWLNKWIVFIGVLSATILFCTFYYLVNACATTAKMVSNRFVYLTFKAIVEVEPSSDFFTSLFNFILSAVYPSAILL